MAPARPIDPHVLARDATFRPATKPEGNVACKACGGDQVIPIPIWDLIAESDQAGEYLVPVALVCLGCWTQSVYQSRWRSDREGEGG